MVNKLTLVIAAAVLAACGGSGDEAEQKLEVQFSRDSLYLLATGIPPQALAEFASDTIDPATFEHVFAVYEESADTTGPLMPAKICRGRYRVEGQALTFKPDTAFTPGRSYRAELAIPNYTNIGKATYGKKLPGQRLMVWELER
jgi:hypothetical protein